MILGNSVKILVEQFIGNSQYPHDRATMATPNWGHQNIPRPFSAPRTEEKDGEDSIFDLQEHTLPGRGRVGVLIYN